MISLIVTVKNEEHTIKCLLDSILCQTKAPDEVIIVDGGSTDMTIDYIKFYEKKFPLLRLICENKVNVPRGRNLAINSAKGDIIVSTDAGCILDEHWIEHIIKPFLDPKIDVVAGFYKPMIKNKWQSVLAKLTFPEKENISEENYMPSSRSIAFKKSIWTLVGGYKEDLNSAEDTYFDIKLKENKACFALALDAVVFWEPRKNVKDFFKQTVWYAKGDRLAGIEAKRNIKSIFRVACLCILIFCILLSFVFEINQIQYIAAVLMILFMLKLFYVMGKYRIYNIPYLLLYYVLLDIGRTLGYIEGRHKH